MIATALDRIPLPPWAGLFGWHLIDALPDDGWIRVGFDGKREFCNAAGFVQGGILSAIASIVLLILTLKTPSVAWRNEPQPL